MLTAQVILGSGAGTWGPEDQGRAYYPHLLPLPFPPPNLFPPSGITAWECLGDASAVSPSPPQPQTGMMAEFHLKFHHSVQIFFFKTSK